MNPEQTINFNYSQCVKSTSAFSETIYKNICNGVTQHVPVGFWDFVVGFTAWAIALGILLGICIGCYKLMRIE